MPKPYTQTPKYKAAQKRRNAKHYQENKAAYKQRARKAKAELKQWFKDLKSELCCRACGFDTHPCALDFHHQDGSDKDAEVSKLVQNGRSRERILNEIAKCIVLCANCHRIEHNKE